MPSNQNLEAIVSYLKNQKISIDFEDFQFQIESHPNYPSLLAFAEALDYFNIPNVVAKVADEDIENIPDSFVAILSEENRTPYLSFVKTKNNTYSYTDENTTKKINKETFEKKWNQIILLVEKSDNIKESQKKDSSLKFISIFVLTIIAFVFWFSKSTFASFYAFTCIIGIYLSVEALKTELGIESKISNSFCQIIRNADCEQIINSSKSSWFQKIKISNFSIWFFSSQLFLLFVFSIGQSYQAFLSYMVWGLYLSIPLTLYSIYFQYKVENKWCPICLSIISVVYLQLILLLDYSFKLNFEIKSFLLFIFCFIAVAISIYYIKPLLLQVKYLKEREIKNLRFRKNYSTFKNSLIHGIQHTFVNNYIILGNPNADLKLTIITSPFCGFCKEVHDITCRILEKHGDFVAVNIRFNFDYKNDEKINQLFYRLLEIYQHNTNIEFLNALSYYYNVKNLEVWYSKYSNPKYEIEFFKEKLMKISKENEMKDLYFTPNIFINQYRFPSQYDRSDLEYFIEDLIEDNEI